MHMKKYNNCKDHIGFSFLTFWKQVNYKQGKIKNKTREGGLGGGGTVEHEITLSDLNKTTECGSKHNKMY